jgi:hypothetical protein
MEQSQDDKGKVNPAGNVPENKPTEAILEQTKKELEDAKKRLSDKETQAQQLTEEIRILRTRKDPLIVQPNYQPPVKRDDDDPDDDFDTKYQSRRLEEKKQEYTRLANFCFERFASDPNLEWSEAVDSAF